MSDLAELLRDWSLAGCEHSMRNSTGFVERSCSPCMRDRILASDWLRRDRARERAEALEDAALFYGPAQITWTGSATSYTKAWLEDRAARIRSDAGIGGGGDG